MSTNKLSHLKEGEKIYLEVDREKSIHDDVHGLLFVNKNHSVFVDDSETFYTLEELKQLANDGMPKQEITVDGSLGDRWSKVNFKGTLKTLPEKGDLINGMQNDNIPKQGDEIEVRTYSTEKEWEIKTVSHTALITTDGKPYALGQWRYPPKKIQKTLAELEKELGYEEGTLEITN